MTEVALHLSILILAFLYSSVGHAGASGYIAAMTLAGIAIPEIRPAALMMNLGVSAFGMWHFIRGGYLRWSLTWPFLVAALPFAFLGGKWHLPDQPLSLILGIGLLFSALRLFLPFLPSPTEPATPKLAISLPTGAALGLLAGLTGTGGGIFLTPLLLMTGWASPKTAAATSIVFIAGNSLSGLSGFAAGNGEIPWHLVSLFPFALVGGFAGSRLGSFRFSPSAIRRLLAIVLLIASGKLLHQALAPAHITAGLQATTSSHRSRLHQQWNLEAP